MKIWRHGNITIKEKIHFDTYIMWKNDWIEYIRSILYHCKNNLELGLSQEFNVAARAAEMARIFSVAVEMHTGLARQRLWAERVSQNEFSLLLPFPLSTRPTRSQNPIAETPDWLSDWLLLGYKAAALSLYYAAGKSCRDTNLKQPGLLTQLLFGWASRDFTQKSLSCIFFKKNVRWC